LVVFSLGAMSGWTRLWNVLIGCLSEGWESLYPRSYLQALSSRCSDHAPVLPQFNDGFNPKRCFRFQAFWP
jgi:hypothetical protein